MKNYQLFHRHGQLEHVITFAYDGADVQLLDCHLLFDGFFFEGRMSDHSQFEAIRANRNEWVPVESEPPYNPSASVAEVQMNWRVYSPEKVQAAREAEALFVKPMNFNPNLQTNI
jgi:hypothetical protein